MKHAFVGSKLGQGTTPRGKGRCCFNRRAIRPKGCGIAGVALAGCLACAGSASAEEVIGAVGESLDPFGGASALDCGRTTVPGGCILARVCSTFTEEYGLSERFPSIGELAFGRPGRPREFELTSNRIGISDEKELSMTVSFAIQSGSCGAIATELGTQKSVLSNSPGAGPSGHMLGAGTRKIKECKWVVGAASNLFTIDH